MPPSPALAACALLTLSSVPASAFLASTPGAALLHLRGGSVFAGFGRAVRPWGNNRQPYSSVVGLRAGATTLSFGTPADKKFELAETEATVVIGKKKILETICGDADASNVLGFAADPALTSAMLQSIDGSGSATSFFPSDAGKAQRLSMGVLPEKTTRNNHPMSVHTITTLLLSTVPTKGNVRIIIAGVGAETGAGALAAAVAKAFPDYSHKTAKGSSASRHVSVWLVDGGGQVISDSVSLKAAQAVSEGVRLATRLVDMTPEELTTEAFAAEANKVAALFPQVTVTEIVGEDLRDKGYGGLYGVGKAARCAPRMVLLSYEPPEASSEYIECVALVGKGVVYDTGGLSLKSKDGMSGMKHDMAGAAGMLGGFYSAVKLETRTRLHLILCLAENAIGPNAFRNDDILRLYSGKTVEINNCDAEGRLVLGDGVAHASQHLTPLDLVVDMATLTGAQLVTTGKKHAGILANSMALEQRACAAGLHSGDLCFPMLYAPELLKDEFKSEVADMKNSVKDRSNAQASCAGHFIESHLSEDYTGGWLHLDMAGPGTRDQRGTGYGVAFVCALLKVPGC